MSDATDTTVTDEDVSEPDAVHALGREVLAYLHAFSAAVEMQYVSRSPGQHPRVFIKDAGGRYLFVNKPFAADQGLVPADMIGRTDGDFHPPALVERYRADDARVMADGQPLSVEEPYQSDGRSRIALTTKSAIAGPDGRTIGVLGILEDITEQRTWERELRRVNWMLHAVTTSHTALVRSESETELMDQVCRALTADNVFVLAWIGEPLDDDQRSVPIRAAAGKALAYIEGLKVSWADNELGQGPTGMAVRTGRPCIVADPTRSQGFSPWAAKARAMGIGSSIALPIRVGRSVDYVMCVYSPEHDAFGSQEVALLERFATDLGFGIGARRTRRAYETAQAEREAEAARFRRGMELTIEAISSTLESRDPYTAGHQQRVAEIAATIAEVMGLDPLRIQGLRLAAMVHDLGKIHIPIQILCKPGRLSRIEFELIKTHPAVGHEILRALDLPWPIADMVHQHHEYLDGSGYPRGLSGEDILLESRILTVADIVESMSAARPYRPALGLAAALEEIQAHSGTRLDPQVVAACLSHFRHVPATSSGTVLV